MSAVVEPEDQLQLAVVPRDAEFGYEGDVEPYDPELFFDSRASAHTQVLHLRGGERFIAAEAIPVMYARMHEALDAIVAEQEDADAVEAAS